MEQHSYTDPADWRALVPCNLETFTASELGEVTGLGTPLAQKVVHCLRHVAVVDGDGQAGTGAPYRVKEI